MKLFVLNLYILASFSSKKISLPDSFQPIDNWVLASFERVSKSRLSFPVPRDRSRLSGPTGSAQTRSCHQAETASAREAAGGWVLAPQGKKKHVASAAAAHAVFLRTSTTPRPPPSRAWGLPPAPTLVVRVGFRV